MPLVVQLDDASLSLPRPLDPATWRVTPRRNEEETVSFLSSSLLADKDAYVSVDQEEDGQHLYVRLLDAREGKVVALISEAEVKLRTDAILLYARDPATNVTGTGAESSASSLWNHPDLCRTGHSQTTRWCLGSASVELKLLFSPTRRHSAETYRTNAFSSTSH